MLFPIYFEWFSVLKNDTMLYLKSQNFKQSMCNLRLFYSSFQIQWARFITSTVWLFGLRSSAILKLLIKVLIGSNLVPLLITSSNFNLSSVLIWVESFGFYLDIHNCFKNICRTALRIFKVLSGFFTFSEVLNWVEIYIT